MTGKPRVLYFCPVPEFKGGAEMVLRDMLRNPGIVPMVAVPAEGPIADHARREGLPVAIVPFGAISEIRRPLRPKLVAAAVRDLFGAARALRKAARTLGADIVHSNGLKAHSVAALARLRGSPPLVVHFHDIPVYANEGRVWRTLGRVATQAVIVSRPCWPDAQLPANVTVVHNGVDLGGWAPSPPPAAPPLVVGFAGRLHPFKGLHLLPDWLAAARAAGIDARLVIRGEAAPEHQGYVAGVKARFAELSLAPHVTFEGRREGLAAIYAGLHAVVVPSDTPEPFGLVVVEAMGLGVPAIGYPAGGILEIIEHGRNGWLAADAAAFVAALRTIAAGGAPLAAVLDAARKTAVEDMSLTAMYARLNGVYARALGRS